jgi:hypothetical protein
MLKDVQCVKAEAAHISIRWYKINVILTVRKLQTEGVSDVSLLKVH